MSSEHIVNEPKAGDPAEITKPESSIPEQYQGKTFEEVIQMHQNAESKIQNQGAELGRLRQLTEEQVAAASKQEDSGPADFYEDPEKHIADMIERKLRPFTEAMTAQNERLVKERLTELHPDWKETSSSKEFQDWVAESPTRVQMFVKAHRADFDAANELFTNYAAVTKAAEASQEVADKAVKRDRKLRAARAEKGSAGVDPRKILNRADLIRLKQTDPNRYNENLPDIRKAYAEGRVR